MESVYAGPDSAPGNLYHRINEAKPGVFLLVKTSNWIQKFTESQGHYLTFFKGTVFYQSIPLWS
jgi:hypothetical protein